MNDKATLFQRHRNRLFGIAYRMLGQRADAEDAVQDVFLRWHAAENVTDPEAWLVRVTTRRCIDLLRGVQRQRETYPGPWLPEPIVEDVDPQLRRAELAHDLSLAFLAVLERLTADERAAFLLHDVFDFDYPEVAEILERSEAASRQLVSRGRRHVREARQRFPVSRDAYLVLLERFRRAAETGNRVDLENLFAADAVYIGDGGGRVAAGLRPLHGGRRIAKLLSVLGRRFGQRQVFHLAEINREPGLLRFVDGKLDAVITMVVAENRIHELLLVRNPEKLAHIAPPPVTTPVH